ncbi:MULTISPECIES: hypothetical protein [Photorhabdus]|nr:hypothetical protein [Photorhabdus asymbiotica]
MTGVSESSQQSSNLKDEGYNSVPVSKAIIFCSSFLNLYMSHRST